MKAVAVCACPSGVAHTFMAAESLSKTAKKLGIQLKVETQGAMGTENKISAEEASQCDFVILTNDVKIKDTERFSGKPLYYVSSHDAIRQSAGLFGKILDELGQG